MASVYKVRGRDGKLLPAYRFKYRDASGKWAYGVGWPDKQKTRDHALSVEAECRAVRMGEKEAPPAWLKNRNVPIGEVIERYMQWGHTQGGRHGKPWDDQNAALKQSYLTW